MSDEKKKDKGPQNEGRDEYFMDIDRYINEGLAGGTVFERERYTNIEEARDLVKEEPPTENQ
ncbi:hypothetical protein ACQCU1_08060 [Sutcliffiella horikoshii]|uniref:Uncharacterized protein n=1 Tax=Sutcliffiella horikoshii TaxID=79883 RepID=A0A1Y0CK43_9BACI|nr:hypothetical protein [Sutcliffiella horikoshii]ART75651.1 hypothetical protein B4U37_06250 [Sutcliffiella horikoshii]TYS60934.1 hypothetical protein FZC74_01240 [Sutcliffiella horikoshii]